MVESSVWFLEIYTAASEIEGNEGSEAIGTPQLLLAEIVRLVQPSIFPSWPMLPVRVLKA
jgi:hypothetical protein